MSGRQQKVPLVDAAAKLVKEPTKDLVWEILRQMECVTRWAIFILAVCLVLFMIYQFRVFRLTLDTTKLTSSVQRYNLDQVIHTWMVYEKQPTRFPRVGDLSRSYHRDCANPPEAFRASA